MKAIFEHMKIKEHTYKIIAGVVAVSITFLWFGMRNNSYAIAVNGEVVAIVKEKEEAKTALEKVVTTIKAEKGVDIVVNDTLSVQPVNSKAKDISSGDQIVAALNKAVTYNIEAYEIMVDGKVQAIVESKEVAADILTKIAKQHLPESAEVILAETDVEDKETNEMAKTDQVVAANQVATDQMATVKQVATANQVAATNQVATANQVTAANQVATTNKEATTNQAATTNQVTTTNQVVNEKSDVEVLQVASALPGAEVKSAIKVEAIKKNEEADTESTEQTSEKGQKIKRELKVFDFNEEVVVRNTYVDTEEIMSAEEAMDILLSNTEEVVEYELKEGDNIWDIAMQNGTTMEHILEINPQIKDETKMQIGEKIKLEVPDPILSISTTEQATYKELIPAEIQYVEFTNLYKDETKVYQEGHDGLKEVTVAVNKINDKEVSRELISEKTLKEPKIKVIAYGTKEKPKNKDGESGQSVKASQSGKFMHPLNGGGRVSSDYGYRGSQFHKGMDIAASAGSPIYASAAGTVIYSGYNSGGYGKLIILDHGNGYQTYYGHNSSLYVQVGQSVSKGQNIAGVGSTGDSTGNHVHFEIRRDGTPINPNNYI